MTGKGEFEFIARQLAPLSAGFEGALSLRDDAALIDVPDGFTLVVTSDTLIEGRHFPVDENPALATRKALRTNLSDLAAMGADPIAYMTNVTWPQTGSDRRMDGFVEGLRQDQSEFGIHLIGGDTTRTDGPWVISITAFGQVPIGQAVKRSGAKPGDDVWVTGTIGDAALGLMMAQGHGLSLSRKDAEWISRRFQIPAPRVNLAERLRDHASAAVDISDGLLADLNHIAYASNTTIEIDLESVPLSEPVRRWLSQQPDQDRALLKLATAGDDYELAVAISPSKAEAFSQWCEAQNVPISKVGHVHERTPEVIANFKGQRLELDRLGFTHF